MSREDIANTLKRLRIESGLTADEVGEMIGKSGKTVNAWENNRGQPDAEILIQLCDIYKVDNILKEFSGEKSELTLSAHEIEIINAYRSNPDMQKAVDRLLKVETVNRVAKIPEMTAEELHAALDSQLKAEEKATEKSEVS